MKLENDISKDLKQITNIVLKSAVSVLNENRIKTSTSEAKIKFKVIINGSDIDIEMPSYYIFVEKGRKPNSKRPPVRAIYNWIKKEKIQIPEGLSAKSFAYAVSNSIAKNGIKPRPFIEDLKDEISILTRDYVVNLINKNIK